MLNAGERLWKIQKKQGTGLCFGLDLHYEPRGRLNEEFYASFVVDDDGRILRDTFIDVFRSMEGLALDVIFDANRAATFLAGITRYNCRLIDAAWDSGIRVFKPQAAFFERLPMVSHIVLAAVCDHLEMRADEEEDAVYFNAGDLKRGDLFETQQAYYDAYLSRRTQEIIPGMNGAYDFDGITVTTWMGTDVLTPGLPYFKDGKGAIVVTRSSNPSGTTLQDIEVSPSDVEVSEKQRPFRYTDEMHEAIPGVLGYPPTASEVMLYLTSKFSKENGLDSQNGVSPIFSVMGSTLDIGKNFRRIRGNGAIALVPGFGAQMGSFHNARHLYVRDGVLLGHLGMLASSRAHNFAWMQKYGGKDDPTQLESETRRAIDTFRVDERSLYLSEGFHYPF